MEFTCDECYKSRQKSIEECPQCGKITLECRVIGCSSHILCSNCDFQVVSAGGFFEPCHEDSREYLLHISEPSENAQLVKLAKILNKNVLELKKQFKDGRIDMKYRVIECLEKKELILKAGVNCGLDGEIERIYPRIINCPYSKGIYEEWPEFNEHWEKVSKIYDLIDANKSIFEDAFVERKASNEDIELAEKMLGVTIPSSYKWYLKEFGHGGYFFEILGVGLTGKIIFAEETISQRANGMPDNLIVIQNCDEYVDCIDVNTGSVVSWSMYDDQGVLNRDMDFYEYLIEEIQNAIDNYDE